MWQSTAVTILALGGLVAGASKLSEGRIRHRWWLRGGVALIAAAAAIVQIPGVLSTRAVRRSQAAEQRGDTPLALAWADSAVSDEPWSATPYEQRGLVLESTGKLAAAARDLRHAIANEPTNYTHWLILSRIETEQGHLGQAARDYEQAHKLRTMGQVFAPTPPAPQPAPQPAPSNP
jgi:cytochrome c-type biogenesis protein CcmH/NrfG